MAVKYLSCLMTGTLTNGIISLHAEQFFTELVSENCYFINYVFWFFFFVLCRFWNSCFLPWSFLCGLNRNTLESSFKPRRLQLLCFIGHFIEWDNSFLFYSFVSDFRNVSEEHLLYRKLRTLNLIKRLLIM